MAPTWETAPLVFIPAPACPRCGEVKPIIIRSLSGGDGSTARRSICRRCGSRFVVVVEPPEFGNDQ
jgi:hypothetical protein